MRVFVSVDMEGVSGVERVHEITPGRIAYDVFCKVMAGDANAVIDGAFAGGASEVVVADGHARMTNIDPRDLDPRARLKSGHGRLLQLKGVSETFDAALLVGYHARSGTSGILSHTFVSSFLDVRLDGVSMGEAGVNERLLRSLGVPVLFLSGDDVTIKEASPQLGDIVSVETKRATGRTSAVHLPLAVSRERLREGARAAVTACAGRGAWSSGGEHTVTLEVDLATSPETSVPPDAVQRNGRFVDSPRSPELSDFELLVELHGLESRDHGTVVLSGPIEAVYESLGRMATSLMERNLEWLYRSTGAEPYTRDVAEVFGDAPLDYIGGTDARDRD
jgi:D-amino peptidase